MDANPKEKSMQIPQVETERLILRDFAPDDLDRLAAILGKAEVMRYMPGGEPFSRERAEKAFNNILGHWEQHGFGWWAVICHADAQLIGWCGLTFVGELGETEVAYLLDEPYWGQGYATEGAQASLRYGFEELQLDRIIALAHTENFASQRVMQKNGMLYETKLHLWGLDLVQYAIARDAFQPGEVAYTLHV
jgi:RimJ/RimL family protein N-acetyltransferase